MSAYFFAKGKVLKVLVVLLVMAITVIYGLSVFVGWSLTHPVRKALDGSPADFGLQYENIEFTSRIDGLKLRGWLLPAPENKLTVICAHGYRQNRVQSDVPLLGLAQILVEHGINVLLFDFRNCGESDGSLTSVGQHEVRDALGAVDFVHTQPELQQKIVLLGFSMGAAVSLLAGEQEPAVTAVIADSPFADLTAYLRSNFAVWTGLPAEPFNQTILSVLPIMTGLQPETVSPIRDIGKLAGRPLLLIHGEADEDIAIANSELLQQAYPQAQLLRIPKADHVHGFTIDSKLYATEVLKFLDKL